MLTFVLLLVAVVLFGVATAITPARFNLVALGLAFGFGAFLVQAWPG
jgi:hypothetical protein